MGRLLALALGLSVALTFCWPSAAAAAPIIVGNGTAASCTEFALKQALMVAAASGGGTIKFKCGPAPVTIALTAPVPNADGQLIHLVLPNHTTIDGGGLVTLDGTHSATVIVVNVGVTAALKRLAIINGDNIDDIAGPTAGGIANAGTLNLTGVTVSGCHSGLTGGIDNNGALTIVDSVISRNGTFFYAGGLTNSGTATVRDTVFEGNVTAFDGGGILSGGTLTVRRSTFSHNTANDGVGGGLAVGGTTVITDSTLVENEAFWGGAVANFGDLKVSHSTVSDNAGLRGGAIYNVGSLKADDSSFSGHFSFNGGGLFMYPGSDGVLTHSRFSDNGGFEGGGIDNFGTLKLKHTTVTGNNAAIAGGGIFNGGALTIDGGVITQNTGFGLYMCTEGQVSSFGGFPCHGTVRLKHATITGNTPGDIGP